MSVIYFQHIYTMMTHEHVIMQVITFKMSFLPGHTLHKKLNEKERKT